MSLKHKGSKAATMLLILFIALLQELWAVELPQLTEETLEQLPSEIRYEMAALYERAQSESADSVRLGQLGMMFHAHEQFQYAEALYEKAQEISPHTFEWIYYLAVARSETGDVETAIESLRSALLIRPGYVPASLRLAELLFETGRIGECQTIYEKLASEFPNLAVVHFGLGRLHSERQDWKKAVESFETAIDLYPKYGGAHYALGQAYKSLGDLEKAKEALAAYQDTRLNRPVVGDGLMEAISQFKSADSRALSLVEKGTELGEKGDLAGAIEEHLKALELSPNLLQAHINLIILYGRAGFSEKAEAQYGKAVELEQNAEEAHYNFGVVLIQEKRYLEAREKFETALQINPLHSSALNNLGQLYEVEQQFDKALQSYQKATSVDPSNRLAYFNTGRMLIARGEHSQAIEQLEKSLSPEDEKTARFTFAISAAYARLGEYEKALEYAERSRLLASKYGQLDLVHAIDRDALRLKRFMENQN